ncbi:MAG: hypothetical protein JWN11_778, partial [Hyphomicrobiales bacterium]|nr:hypothetical protein [Hyphomicrobiales bacterium]
MTMRNALTTGLMTAGLALVGTSMFLSPGWAQEAAKPAEKPAEMAAGSLVSSDRLLKAGSDAEAGNWLMVHRTYNSDRFSPLKNITPDNVSGLKLAFAVPLGGLEPSSFGVGGIEATPLAKDGFLY